MTELNIIQQLSHFEMQILTGKQAVTQRNKILSQLQDQGSTYSELHRLLNTVRESIGSPNITHDGVLKAITRYRAKNFISVRQNPEQVDHRKGYSLGPLSQL